MFARCIVAAGRMKERRGLLSVCGRGAPTLGGS